MGLTVAFKGLSNDEKEMGSAAGKTVHDIK
jgi:hypothetical protein